MGAPTAQYAQRRLRCSAIHARVDSRLELLLGGGELGGGQRHGRRGEEEERR